MNVYLLRAGTTNFYKIGVSKNTETRVNQLQTGHNETLLLVHQFKTKHDYQLEGYLHRRFTDKNVQLEWFELDKTDVDGFLTACAQGESNFDIVLSENTYVQDKNASRTRKRNSYKGTGFTQDY
jgi:hypothetical protein